MFPGFARLPLFADYSIMVIKIEKEITENEFRYRQRNKKYIVSHFNMIFYIGCD